MAIIIDLDFYRRFHIVLPIHPRAQKKLKSAKRHTAKTIRAGRRRRLQPSSQEAKNSDT